jgi:hypothetical protein
MYAYAAVFVQRDFSFSVSGFKALPRREILSLRSSIAKGNQRNIFR